MASATNREEAAWEQRHQRMEWMKKIKFLEDSRTMNNKLMNHKLYDSATKDTVDNFLHHLENVLLEEQVSLTTIFNRLSPSGNSLLHVAASKDKVDTTTLLAVHYPERITLKNFQGDTAIHLAARDENINTLRALVTLGERNYGAGGLLGLKNNKGNTPLHEAVINKKYRAALLLLQAAPQVAYHQNEEGIHQEGLMQGKSPLFIAAENEDKEMFSHLLQAIARRDDVGSLEGLSPAHAAIRQQNMEILKLIAEQKPELLRAKENKGSNLLHFASCVGYLDGVKFLSQELVDGTIEKNEDGLCPIHLACEKGHLKVVKELLYQWPDAAEFVNDKGQNILHVAAENGRQNVVNYILEIPEFFSLLNQTDVDGNTPLHLATKNRHSMVVLALAKHPKVYKVIVNNENLTPYDEAKKQTIEMEECDEENSISDGKQGEGDAAKNKKTDCFTKRLDPYGLLMTHAILFFYGKPNLSSLDHFDRIKHKPLSREDIRGRIEVLLVAAVLVAGATFNGACQVPKSVSRGDGNDQMDKRSNTLLTCYFLFDLLALNLSVVAAIVICWVQLFDTGLSTHLLWVVSAVVGASIYQMFLAFLLALAIDAKEISLVYVSIIVVGAIFLIVNFLLCIPLLIPPHANKMIERSLSPFFYFFASLLVNSYFHFCHNIIVSSYLASYRFIVRIISASGRKLA